MLAPHGAYHLEKKMSVNFKDLLSVNLDEVKAPLALPEGTYHGTIASFEYGDNNKNKTPYVRFGLKFHSASDDVDPKDLAEIDLSTRKMSTDFYLTPDARFRLKDFLVSLGLKTEGMSFDELIPEAVGQSVIAYVTQRFNPERPDDPPRNNIKSVRGE
jgi:hypothetical protein